MNKQEVFENKKKEILQEQLDSISLLAEIQKQELVLE
jgi:hypothetical protein